ncbi:MAG: PQQ-binding-like beta-propeller repeat protein [Pirellulales bacterium]|nr:PQQ-binding-like beta-propeller repeat protein [Pirellulales bacterium]
MILGKRCPAISIQTAFVAVGLLAASGLCSAAAPPDPLDWPNWRGPQQNRVSTEKGLIDTWNPEGGPGSHVLWKSAALGGRSTPIVLRGKLYTIVRDQKNSPTEGEKVVCADANTGKILWEHRFNVYLSEVPADRVGWSSCVGDPETGRIYAQGVCGYFCCLEGDSGKLVWDHSLHEELGLISTYGGRTNFPILFEDNLLISAVIVGWGDEPKWGNLARPAHRFMCFDKATGELRWLNGTNISPYDTTFSTPTVQPIGGQSQLVFSSGDGGVWSLQPRTGKVVWNFPFGRAGINVSPLVAPDGKVYTTQGVENTVGNTMGGVVALDGTMAGNLAGKELWRHFEVLGGTASPVMLDGRVYVLDDTARLFVFDAKTGNKIFSKKLDTTQRATPLVAEGKLYVLTGSKWFVLKPTASGVEVVSQFRMREEGFDASPIVSHGKIYVSASEHMYCLGRADAQPQADPLPPPPKEGSGGEQGIATVQIVPYDILLAPGDSHQFKVRLFNARGQAFLDAASPKWHFTVDGPGSISAEGKFSAPAENKHQCSVITCKVGEVTGTARVRIVPPLPWKFDFNDDSAVPLSWLGGRVRWEVREQNGEKYIAKKTILPTPKNPKNKLGTRSFIWMGPTHLANYTIQADVLLKEQEGKMADVGVIASGYQFTIRSLSQTLKLDSWTSNDYRSFAEAPFKPIHDTWYTLKLSVVPGEGQAAVRGKAWKRGEAEPSKWTLEMVDRAPNLRGTPAIFGNSPDAEIYLDNLLVTPN